MAIINPSRYALMIHAAWSICVNEMLMPGSAMILGSAVTTTVWSSAVKKTPIQAIVSAASAMRLSRLLTMVCLGVVSFLNELVICCGERRWASEELVDAGALLPPVPCSCGTAGVDALGAFTKSRLRRLADVSWSSSNVYI